MQYIAVVFGHILAFCFYLGKNYILAVILMTIFSKAVLWPVSLWTQKNSIKMAAVQPQLNAIRVKFFGDKDRIADETAALYEKEHYNPFAGVIPLILQIIILIGIIEVVRQPAYAGMELADMAAWGIHFYEYPYQAGGWYWAMPLSAGASSLLLGFAQSRMNPLQSVQPWKEQAGTVLFSVGISLALGAFVPAGVGFYWICSNVLSILQQFVLNKVTKPDKYIDYDAIIESRKQLDELQSVGEGRHRFAKHPYAAREKADYKRFFSVANKHIVFYSESNGFYKYFERLIAYLLDHSNLTIHYITSDPADSIFEKAEKNSRIRAYYIGEKRLITLMMKMDADIVVMTMPDLENYHIKRSYIKQDIEYIYMFHWCTSTHMVIREKALDHYDTVFCPGPYQTAEIRYAEKLRTLPPKNLIETGYGVIESLAEAYESKIQAGSVEANEKKKQESPARANEGKKQENLVETNEGKNQETKRHGVPQILIAPSYQEGCIMDSCIDQLLEQLVQAQCSVVVRPHPQYIRRKPQDIEAFKRRHDTELEQGIFEFQEDFISGDTVWQSDLVVTDWSTIAYEYSLTTMKPSLFINTPMKVVNPNYKQYPMQPLDITLRSRIGRALETDEVKEAGRMVKEMLSCTDDWKEQIASVRGEIMPEFGNSAQIGGKYILSRLVEKKERGRVSSR